MRTIERQNKKSATKLFEFWQTRLKAIYFFQKAVVQNLL